MAGLSDFGVASYGDPLEEARRCRTRCALFDFSFMFRARVSGRRARTLLTGAQTRDLGDLRPGEVRYGLRLDRQGAVRSDVTIWDLGDSTFDLYSGDPMDVRRLSQLATSGVTVADLSRDTAVYAVQGPATLDVLAAVCDAEPLGKLRFFQHTFHVVAGIPCIVGRLGYTGERGFEIIPTDVSHAGNLWSALSCIAPAAGMIAADILRNEAGYLLFANDCRFGANPSELGLGRFSRSVAQRRHYRRRYFLAANMVMSAPYAAPERPDLPAPGDLVVTSAAPSALFDGVIGMGLSRDLDDVGRLVFQDRVVEKSFHLQGQPFYDPDKQVARGAW